eukprot:EG_transcript_26365
MALPTQHEAEGALEGKACLHQFIDLPRVRALNESVHGAWRLVLRPLADCGEGGPGLFSDTDEELLLFVPFTEVVRLHSVAVRGGAGDSAPSRLRLFLNREDMDFDLAHDSVALQEWELPAGGATVDCPVNRCNTQFSLVTDMTLHFPSNFGASKPGGPPSRTSSKPQAHPAHRGGSPPTTSLAFVGLSGQTTGMSAKPQATPTVHEGTPNPKDDPVPDSISPDVSAEGGAGP